jgi:hypothetical protein
MTYDHDSFILLSILVAPIVRLVATAPSNGEDIESKNKGDAKKSYCCAKKRVKRQSSHDDVNTILVRTILP